MKILAAYVPSIGNIDFPTTKPGITDAASLLATVITWLLGFAGALAVVAIIYSGIMYMTAGGDQEKALKARKNLLWAILGVIIVFLSYAIVRSIGNIIGETP